MCGVVQQRKQRGIDRAGIDQRLIALNVDDQFGVGKGGRDFRHTIGTGKMVFSGHLDTGAKASGFVADALVVGGDNDGGKIARHGDTLVNMFQHGSGVETGKSFSGEAGRCVPGRNNAQDFRRHTRSYHTKKRSLSRFTTSIQKGKHTMPSRYAPILLAALAVGVFAADPPGPDRSTPVAAVATQTGISRRRPREHCSPPQSRRGIAYPSPKRISESIPTSFWFR